MLDLFCQSVVIDRTTIFYKLNIFYGGFMIYFFSIKGIDLIFDSKISRLERVNQTNVIKKVDISSSKYSSILNFILDKKVSNDIIKYSDFLGFAADNSKDPKRGRDKEVGRAIEEIIKVSDSHLTKKDIYKLDKGIFLFDHPVQKFDSRSQIIQPNSSEEKGEIDLFDFLCSRSGIDEEILYSTGNIKLPFFLLPKHKVKFPMKVSNVESFEEKHDDSLRKERKPAYNGNIYRLLSIENDQWTIAPSCYFDILESSDYLGTRLKSAHQDFLNEKQNRRSELMEIREKRIKSFIQNGDFSQYIAGIAFSMPIFRKLDNGGLQLLKGKISSFKATGSGRMHVCPAGMLENPVMFKNKGGERILLNPYLTLEDFQAALCKELLEEAVFSEKILKNINESKYKSTILMFCDQISRPVEQSVKLSTLSYFLKEEIQPYWYEIWESLKTGIDCPSIEPLNYILNLKEDFSPFYIIDTFNLRPEIIVPVYINDELFQITNWEYTDGGSEIIEWANFENLQNWVEKHYKDWCPPGIAAAYLGARQFFKGSI